MKRLLLTLLLLLPALLRAQLPVRLDVYEPALKWTPGMTLTDSIDGPVWDCLLRVQPPKHKGLDLGITINDVCSLRMSCEAAVDDDLCPSPVELLIILSPKAIQNDRKPRPDSLLLYRELREGLDSRSRIYTLRLRGNGQRLTVSAARGAEHEHGSFELRLPDTLQPHTLSYDTFADCQLLEHAFGQDADSPWPEYSRFADPGELQAYLAESTDPREGMWTYFDRDTHPAGTSLGGKYKIATVANGQGGYEIVYVSGAKQHSADWQPMRLKGRLLRTGFISQYDLQWIQPDGRQLSNECSAELTAEGMLTLRFPAAAATVRFRKI